MQSPDQIPVHMLADEVTEVHTKRGTPSQPSEPTCRCSSPISNCILPKGWRESLPIADHSWVSDALFKTNAKSGKPELDFTRVVKLWWHPPQAPLICSEVPQPSLYFAQPLLIWMPRKLWRCKFTCKTCEKELTSAGIYRKVRQVLDVDGYYNLATEYLECVSCGIKVAGWDRAIVKQLDIGHRLQFPALLTYKYACDVRVIRPLRERTLGNGATRLFKTLSEQHTEKYFQKVLHYLTDCDHFKASYDSAMLESCPEFVQPPDFNPVPTAQWLQTAYLEDILSRLDEIKSSITSTFGSIIRMDSTTKLAKKLAGTARNTAASTVNVGNEHGQILISVLTCAEGDGLVDMAAGLTKRYIDADVCPPEILYVERGCCGSERAHLRKLFENWPNLRISLDIWHFISRFADGCTIKSHPLYAEFIARLSDCFFVLSEEDWTLLKRAKKSEMLAELIPNPSENDVIGCISESEISLHCRRGTREPANVKTLVHNLLKIFASPKGNDALGVPLLDSSRIWRIWEIEQKHLACINDPEGIPLYTQTGTLVKGGVTLPVYRSARCASLDSFQSHLNRFIPGRCANAAHFQAYLLEGLYRWNKDRAANAVTANSTCTLRSYSGLLSKAVHSLGMETFGTELCSAPAEIGQYTGELIGVDYLYSQTGRPLPPLLDEDGQAILYNQDESLDVEDEGIGLTEDVTICDGVMLAADTDFVQLEDRGPIMSSDQVVSIDEPFNNVRVADSLLRGSVPPNNIPRYEKAAALVDSPLAVNDRCVSLSEEQAQKCVSSDQYVSNNEPDDNVCVPDSTVQGSVQPNNIPGCGKASASADCPPTFRDCSVSLSEGEAQKVKRQETQAVRDTTQQVLLMQPMPTESSTPALEGEFVEILLSGTAKKQDAGCRTKYRPRTGLSTCNKCGEPRTADTHNQYYGNQFCKATSAVSYGVWLKAVKERGYKKRPPRTLSDVLRQGFPKLTTPTITKTLPPSKQKVATPPTPELQRQLVFVLPLNTTFTAETQPATKPPESSLPSSTKYYRKRRSVDEAAGLTSRRRYKPRTGRSVCSKCGKPRTADSHKQFYGNQFCAETSAVSHEVWLKELKDKGYGRRVKRKQ